MGAQQAVLLFQLFYCLCMVLHVFLVSMWVFSGFSGFLPPPKKHTSRCISSNFKFILCEGVCECVYLHGAL